MTTASTIEDQMMLEQGYVNPDTFRDAMQYLCGTVTVLTSGIGADRRGMTATAVCSVSADPPTVFACVNKNATVHEMIDRTGNFCINILSPAQEEVARRFASREARQQRGLHFQSDDPKASPRIAGSLVQIDCVVSRTVDCGSHTGFFGHVREASIAGGPASPLLYLQRCFASLPIGDTAVA